MELESKFPFKIDKSKKWNAKNNLNICYLLKSGVYHFFRFLYKKTSNYGESIIKPIIAIFTIYVLITVISGEYSSLFSFISKTNDVSLCNLDLMNYDIKKCPDGWYKIAGKSFTYIGLFLTGLALKNKFKIK